MSGSPIEDRVIGGVRMREQDDGEVSVEREVAAMSISFVRVGNRDTANNCIVRRDKRFPSRQILPCDDRSELSRSETIPSCSKRRRIWRLSFLPIRSYFRCSLHSLKISKNKKHQLFLIKQTFRSLMFRGTFLKKYWYCIAKLQMIHRKNTKTKHRYFRFPGNPLVC